jgi:multiple sugar transport system permease protein
MEATELSGRAGSLHVTASQRPRVLALAIRYVVVIAIGFVIAMPYLWMVSTSLKVRGKEVAIRPELIPDPIAWGNYPELFTLLPFMQWFWNSIVIVVLTMAGRLLTASLAGYAFARLRFPFRRAMFAICLSTLMLPDVVTLIPTFILFHYLGWVNTNLPLWVPAWFGGGAFAIFLIRQFIMTLPRELDEAAIIDGASYFRVFWNILLPLCKPALATLAIISFIAHWDSFLDPVVFLHSPENFTIAVGLWFFKATPDVTNRPVMHLLMAASVVSIIVPISLFFAFQRYFIQGIALTGLKG